jgi:hypothetical protein
MVRDTIDGRRWHVHTLIKRFIRFVSKAALLVFLLDLVAAIAVLAAAYFGYHQLL